MQHLLTVILQIKRICMSSIIILFLILSILIPADELFALSESTGENLFIEHCSGCHVKGGNIVRRNKNLKISTLKRNGLDNPEKIAKVVRLGVGIMSGYEKSLNKGDDQIIANWVLEQAQNAWIQG